MEAVIFDMDGVIFDSEREVLYSWQIVAQKYGIKEIETVCRKCLGCNYDKTLQIMKEHYGEDFDYETYKKETSRIFHERNDGGKLPLKPGVVELLKVLKQKNYPVALASSTRKAVVEQELQDAKLLEYFDVLVCGDMVKNSKPSPEIFLTASEKLGVDPEDCFVIEDSFNGIRAAYEAGMYGVMVPDLAEPDMEMYEKACDILPNLMEFQKKYIEK